MVPWVWIADILFTSVRKHAPYRIEERTFALRAQADRMSAIRAFTILTCVV
jgi:hypothetical protein